MDDVESSEEEEEEDEKVCELYCCLSSLASYFGCQNIYAVECFQKTPHHCSVIRAAGDALSPTMAVKQTFYRGTLPDKL